MPDYDLIIIGGGPAGLTAGLYAGRAKLKTLLVEEGATGGPTSITAEIENYPGFPEGIQSQELMERMLKQAQKFGLKVKTFSKVVKLGVREELKEITVENEERLVFSSYAVIVATGARPRRLGIPGEKEFTGRGVSYCATCDGALFKDKKVLVIGGGNAAVEEAVYLTKFASEVTIVHRRNQLRADKVLQERALNHPKINFLWNSSLVEIQGDKIVKRGLILDLQTKRKRAVETDGIFIYIGVEPNTNFVKNVLELDEKGYIITDDKLQTSINGVFAAGDCRRNNLKQIIIAAGEGALAATMSERYIEEVKGARV